ncbi:MAG: tripeptide aminopeptidase PepT, partial [Elusimicrobiales bacterium]|nr:tripeptide aminopeptidase PepT [Elusimicrobiales bacterium]
MNEIKNKLYERLKRYSEIETTSNPSSDKYPSTDSQRKFAEIIANELKEIGVKDVFVDKYSYVFGKIPSNSVSVEKIGFIAHMDTSPAYSAKNVKVKLHRNYRGGKIIIGNGMYIDEKNTPPLSFHKGHDIVTASGNTLLGADNKAGIAIIITAAEYLIKNNLKHPNITILFTPDEEIGKGVDKLDLKKLDCNFAFTFDGDLIGTIENETFNADSVTITIKGKSVHPGSA